ncbi:LCP family protein [Clostridium fallax]|uniref:Transcriptional attenuator, LytR family n=1 Tax=Clostridium fallax TaxID=1533 RepID=A0A1M4WTQ5_9CLOT|nr:LCP family protein [Clostridium fallax]SHE84626.1 transcriptional attenuator, LytR family [Clostridium fallax]SQB07402.1 cell envelope-related transcriptional attenuator [Clostridium fallax]
MKKYVKLIIILIISIIALISIYMYKNIKTLTYKEDNIDFKEIKEDLKEENLKEKEDTINILLIGTDKREESERGRADSIIIGTLDNKNNKIKLTSILRDTYVDIYNHDKDKINSAYSFGGANLLCDTIYRNLNIKIDKYIEINFWGFEEVIDKLGGVEIEVKDYEIKEINKYIGEFNEEKSKKLEKRGRQILDGQQTLAYARIRKVGDGIYERDERQRRVLKLLFEKLKNINPIEYPSLISTALENIQTNIEPVTLLKYLYFAYKINDSNIEQIQIPTKEYSEGKLYKGKWVILMDKEKNSEIINKFIYEN